MTNQFQQELLAKLREGITPSQIKNSKPFTPSPSLNSLNNLGSKQQPFTMKKPPPNHPYQLLWILTEYLNMENIC